MATIKAIEAKIEKIEGYKVHVRYEDGRDVRGDRANLPTYPYERALKNSANVSDWTQNRFKATYPGFDVDVLNYSGKRVHGRTKLATVRDTYLPG
ncbi:MAG: hypothetical protein ACR2MN_13375 [Acidimicrobiales bacterium]